MITCEICGMVFREEDWKEFNLHNTVAHLHEYRAVRPIIKYLDNSVIDSYDWGWITHTDEEIQVRDRLIEDTLKRLNAVGYDYT